MVVRSRARAVIVPIVFYLVLGVASGYLVWQASNGQRGLEAAAQYNAEEVKLQAELASLQSERRRWTHRVEALSPESVDRDLLEEEAHLLLDRVYKDEVVIFTSPARPL